MTMAKREKTYKRELAFTLVLYLFYLGFYDKVAVLEILAWPFMFFVGTSFGMDWASFQTTLATRGRRNDTT